MLYLKEGRIPHVQIEKIILGPDYALQFKVRTLSGVKIETTKEFLCDPKSPDIGWISLLS